MADFLGVFSQPARDRGRPGVRTTSHWPDSLSSAVTSPARTNASDAQCVRSRPRVRAFYQTERRTISFFDHATGIMYPDMVHISRRKEDGE